MRKKRTLKVEFVKVCIISGNEINLFTSNFSFLTYLKAFMVKKSPQTTPYTNPIIPLFIKNEKKNKNY